MAVRKFEKQGAGVKFVNHVFVIGAGAWGTGLALSAHRAGCSAMVWSIFPEEVKAINTHHENILRLPNIKLPNELSATLDPGEVSKAEIVILAPPAQFMRNVCENFSNKIAPTIPLIIASKGIEKDTCLLMSEIVSEHFPENPLLVLSGPSFANDVAMARPTAVSLSASHLDVSQKIANQLSSPTFKLYPNNDLIGTQIGGACKNVIAIACGIVDGLSLGDNTRSAFLTYGLAEMTRLGCAMGGNPNTFLGLSGVGDLTLTALSSQSRNQSFGFALGQGTPLSKLLGNKDTLTEGVHTVNGMVQLANKFKTEMPITFALAELLNASLSIESFINKIVQQSIPMEV